MEEYIQINLSNLLKEIGEDRTNSVLSTFSCPVNKDIEDFLKNKAISFSNIYRICENTFSIFEEK